MIGCLVIAGASGDLVGRYLMPALARLHASGALPAEFRVVGLARAERDTAAFRQHMAERLERHAPDVAPESRAAVLGMLEYQRRDVADPVQLGAALQSEREPLALYLALPTSILVRTVEAVTGLGLPDGSRVVIEKPFGEDLASAQQLNRLLQARFSEQAIFRVDHFVAEQIFQSILGLRFGNGVFEPLWDRRHVSKVEIIWDETLGLEGRAGYYDAAGAVRDLIQNHLLQVLCLVCLEPPTSLEANALHDRRIELFQAVRRLSPNEVARWTTRARYGAGQVGDRLLPAYVDEPGVDPARGTETFAQLTLRVDNERWSDVPFVLRTGKALGRDRREVVIHFRPASHSTFGRDQRTANILRLMLDPDRLSLEVNVNGPAGLSELAPLSIVGEYPRQNLGAYGRLLLAILEGDTTLSVGGDEAEACWAIVEPILAAWRAGASPLLEYPAGSDGPPPPQDA